MTSSSSGADASAGLFTSGDWLDHEDATVQLEVIALSMNLNLCLVADFQPEMVIFRSLLFPLSLLSSVVGSLIRVPISYEKVTKEADVYALVGKVTLGSQNVYGFIDTGGSTTFFLWKHWYEKGHPGRCKDIIFGCYECSPEPCSEEKPYTLDFGDGSEVRIFKESATAHFGSAVSASISFGLLAEYTYGPNVPVPHAGFGLAPQDDPKSPYIPIIEQLLARELIESSIFSIYLRPDGTNERGELLLGGSDPSMYKSPLVYVAVTTEDRFVRVTGFSLGGSAYPVMAVNDDGILDTGAECIFIPMHRYTLPTLIKDLEVRSSSKVTITQRGSKLIVNCNQRQHLPPIEFLLKGLDGPDVKVKIPSDAYVDIRTDAQGRAYCRVLLNVTDYPLWAIGLPSLIGRYFLYDWTNNKIGISELK
ncbi:Pepsin B precursor, putative [Perkinsus marinus ATCC 50983]|uniref:Pepsin B, putative n=1 Tax=Perkinsus marinus (strain ATCC 50983 / TXsc) TaxID=423536 RepID=C5LSQ2_PERM5|nr:Pepsin B precursor, putative [Perkinsus marinus ATCC 50983]EER00293.1 Pepsin B precursor, putative [Perkinsus marinus ATCC 50983]|eukprot:XP_002767575.1 Pepsin B precursor, putative [Perkinsus marinus ATCC 50983]